MKKTSAISNRLGVKIVGGLRETSTPWAGVSLLVDLFRHVAMDGVANKVLPAKGRWSNMRTRHVGRHG